MEKLIINSKLSDEEKILKIIEFVKSHEREGGLTDEQIAHKYVHGDCACLASLINWFIPNAKIRWIGEEEHAHAFVTIVDPRYKGQKGPFYDHENLMLFDINGKKLMKKCASL